MGFTDPVTRFLLPVFTQPRTTSIVSLMTYWQWPVIYFLNAGAAASECLSLYPKPPYTLTKITISRKMQIPFI
ncbi:MAG TPA: hypothetical protein VFR08_11240 [Candidatus Angelobacter sp.]|nr:hypothetical protein [Candidatus Angelobacter sp.]